MSSSPLPLGIDIGGSGIKGAPVDLEAGTFAADRVRIETPGSSTPKAVVKIVSEFIPLGDGQFDSRFVCDCVCVCVCDCDELRVRRRLTLMRLRPAMRKLRCSVSRQSRRNSDRRMK